MVSLVGTIHEKLYNLMTHFSPNFLKCRLQLS